MFQCNSFHLFHHVSFTCTTRFGFPLVNGHSRPVYILFLSFSYSQSFPTHLPGTHTDRRVASHAESSEGVGSPATRPPNWTTTELLTEAKCLYISPLPWSRTGRSAVYSNCFSIIQMLSAFKCIAHGECFYLRSYTIAKSYWMVRHIFVHFQVQVTLRGLYTETTHFCICLWGVCLL